MPDVSRQYSSPDRYLLKTLRELAHQIEGLVMELDAPTLRWRPAADQWCALEIVGFLRESEREDLAAVQAMIARDGAPLAERRAQHAPAEHDFRRNHVEALLWDFADLRERLVWALRAAGESWQHRGLHPYRGDVTLQQWVREINERDLEAMWQLHRLHEQAAARDPRTPARSQAERAPQRR
ncbi:MAG: hypothetical protein EXR65_00870 [Dehalococcoidia bacterium]|nr:hypothetical protein [Dehalococcoidia bacterium]